MFIRKEKKAPEEPLNAEELFVRYSNYVNGLDSARWRNLVIIGLVVSAVLITAASIQLDFISRWVNTAVGTPGGIILFLISLGLVYRTSLKELGLFRLRETRSFLSRIKIIALWFVLFLLVFIPLGAVVPYGVGGAVLIMLVLAALTTARRTPIELEYVKQGIPDPRDLSDEDYEEEDAPTISTTETPLDPAQPASGRIN